MIRAETMLQVSSQAKEPIPSSLERQNLSPQVLQRVRLRTRTKSPTLRAHHRKPRTSPRRLVHQRSLAQLALGGYLILALRMLASNILVRSFRPGHGKMPYISEGTEPGLRPW